MKSVHTPFSTDSQFEIVLSEELPASSSELSQLIHPYGGTYAEILGQLLCVFIWTRPDLEYSCTCLGKYTQGPTPSSVAGLYCVICYLCTHLHRPILYPHKRIEGFHTLRVDFDPPKFESLQLTHGFIIIVDADHGRYL